MPVCPFLPIKFFNLQKYDIYLDFSHIISNSLVFKACNAGRAKFIFSHHEGKRVKINPDIKLR